MPMLRVGNPKEDHLMTQANHSPIRYDDEVLRFWAAQARQQQAALEALCDYFDTVSFAGSKQEQ